MCIYARCTGTNTVNNVDDHQDRVGPHQQHRRLREGDRGGADAAAEAGCEHAVRGTAGGGAGEEEGEDEWVP